MVDLNDYKLMSEPTTGSLWTPPAARQDIRFVWSGDTAGQGWGIDLDRGGMTCCETMRSVEPAFFVHSGDTSIDLLAARASQAFFDYMPIRRHPAEPERVYAAFTCGPSLDMFSIDKRTYRGPNTSNDQARPGPDTRFFGEEQKRWLKRSLLASNATWKVIASDMPVGLVVADGENQFENGANGDGPVRGREHDLAEMLRFIRDNGIQNVVWLTADVHYTAAHYYDPNKAQFQDFSPFWEFVSGPIHAGSFGPNKLDNTFGPEVKFMKAPAGGQSNLPPSDGLQFFGQVDIDGATDVMIVQLKDLTGETLYSKEVTPEV